MLKIDKLNAWYGPSHILQDVNPRAHVDEVLKVCKELVGHRINAN